MSARPAGLVEQVAAQMERRGWSAQDVHVRCPDMSRQLVESVLAGRREVTAFVKPRLEEFLAQCEAGRWDEDGPAGVVDIREARRERTRRPAPKRTHYQTEFVEQLHKALNFAARRAQIVLITAQYGGGKTHAVGRWLLENGVKEDAVLTKINRLNKSNKYVFLDQLARALAVDVERVTTSVRAAAAFDGIVQRLRDEPALLIFDQCEPAFTEILQLIRDIWDETHDAGVGVALVASEELWMRLTRSRAGDLGALTSRIAAHFVLQGIGAGELRAITQAEGVEIDEKTAQAWAHLAGGSMRRLVESLELIKAGHKGRAVTPKTLEGVFRMQI